MSTGCAIATCKRASRALCYCCQQNLCRTHFDQHDDAINSQLNPLADQINILGVQINELNFDEIIGESRQQLEKWKDDCYKKIDTIFKQKYQELEDYLVEKINKQRDKLDGMRLRVDELLREHEATDDDIKTLTQTIEDVQREINKIEQTPVKLDILPVFVDDSFIRIIGQFDISNLPSPYRTLDCIDVKNPTLANNDQFLLLPQGNNLCLINQDLAIVKEISWTHGPITDMCWSSILSSFIVISLDEIFIINQTTISIEQVQTSKQFEWWYSCTCSESSLFLSSKGWGSSIFVFDLLPSIQFVKEWESPDTCSKDERILDIVYNNDTLALVLENRPYKAVYMSLRNLSTLKPNWSLRFEAYYGNHTLCCCLLRWNEWLVVDEHKSCLFHITKDEKLKAICAYDPKPSYATLFGANILVVSTEKTINFYKL